MVITFLSSLGSFPLCCFTAERSSELSGSMDCLQKISYILEGSVEKSLLLPAEKRGLILNPSIFEF